MALLHRLPILIWAGAALLGWIAGDVIATDPAIHPMLNRLVDGQIALNLDATSAVFGAAPHFSFGGNVGELAFSLLGAVAVLLAGSIWRRSRLQRADRVVLP